MISLPHKTVFIHIPKCGGQSVERAFLHDIGLEWETHRALFLLMRKPAPEMPGRHPRLSHLRAVEYPENYLPRELFLSFYRFAVVRNPFDRLRSTFFDLKLHKQLAFERFVTQVLPRAVHRRPFFAPQTAYLLDEEDELLVDQVYRLEEIDVGWRQIQERSGVKSALPHSNRSPGQAPLTWTDDMVDAVCHVYGRDISLLGYAPVPSEL